jgi:hypothetical protein
MVRLFGEPGSKLDDEGKSEQAASEGLVAVNAFAEGNLLYLSFVRSLAELERLLDVVFCSDMVPFAPHLFILAICLRHPSWGATGALYSRSG